MIIDENDYSDEVVVEEEEFIEHYGTPRHSGRYPWGSSGWGDPNLRKSPQRNKTFLDYIDDMKRSGMTELEVAKGVGLDSTTELRAHKTIASNEQTRSLISQIDRMSEKGMSNVAIGQRLGRNESSIRALRAPGAKEKADILINTANMLEEQVKDKGIIDVGSGVETHLGISETKLKAAVAILKAKGYFVDQIPVPQLGTGKDTRTRIVAAPGTTWGDAVKNRTNIQQIVPFSEDGGRTFRSRLGLQKPVSIDSKRIKINYAEDGGSKADGVIYIRPGVEDVSIGKSNYAQVRVAVDESHYLKGMALYKNDLPDGVDLVFNTNKSSTGDDHDAMKPMERDDLTGEVDKDNPFGSVIERQLVKTDEDGNDKVYSAMNIVNKEGNWLHWSKTLSSQMLSKQSPTLARTQLRKTVDEKKRQFEEIMTLTNPTVKKKLLEAFADSTDSASVHLKAAAFSQKTGHHAILPVESLSPTEVYAPNYNDGDRVVLIRHPHGGTFEIPELIVNNKHKEARALLGQARDAIGINHQVAERLSGADFDGDTVIVIPNNQGRVKTTPALEGLKNFDPQAEFPGYDGMPVINTQSEMGRISNLITDMTIQGANPDELVRAVKHSMVVIDSAKHNLNYKESAKVNGIAALKTRYQGGPRAGASTLISRAGAEIRVPQRIPRKASEGGPVDPVTGEKVYTPTGKTYVNAKGEVKDKVTRSKKLAEVTDAHALTSGPPDSEGTPIERVYADHSNELKGMANTARREALKTPPLKYSRTAAKTYADQVRSLDAKYKLALMNRPRERQAQVIGNATYKARREANPNMDEEVERKVKFQALNEARKRTGAEGHEIHIEQDEWDAIQAGAISNHRLSEMLKKANLKRVQQLATPRTQRVMSPAKLTRARAMMASGATRAQVAEALGVALGTLDEALYQ